MSNVSSSNGLEKYPKLRFKGFSEPWISTVLSDTFKKNSKKNTDGEITNVICNSAKNGLIPQREYFDKDIANADNTDGYYIIEKDDFVYNPRKSAEAPYGPVSIYKYAEKGIVSPLYLCFRALHPINAEFFDFYFKSSAWHRYIYLAGDSGARHDRVSIRDDVFFAMPINLPSEAEQHKISSLLSSIEKRIKAQAALVENLKKYKRGLLSAVFSHKLTFGTGAEWHETTISECLQYEQPQKYIVETEQYDDSYSTPVLTANKAFILGYTNESTDIYEKGDVVIYDDFTMDMKYVTFPFKVKSSTIKMLTPRQGFDLYFVYALLQSLELQPEGHQRSYISKVEPMVVKVPCYEEQVKISNFLQKCDSRVHQEEETLTKLLQYKSGLFQSLFI